MIQSEHLKRSSWTRGTLTNIEQYKLNMEANDDKCLSTEKLPLGKVVEKDHLIG